MARSTKPIGSRSASSGVAATSRSSIRPTRSSTSRYSGSQAWRTVADRRRQIARLPSGSGGPCGMSSWLLSSVRPRRRRRGRAGHVAVFRALERARSSSMSSSLGRSARRLRRPDRPAVLMFGVVDGRAAGRARRRTRCRSQASAPSRARAETAARPFSSQARSSGSRSSSSPQLVAGAGEEVVERPSSISTVGSWAEVMPGPNEAAGLIEAGSGCLPGFLVSPRFCDPLRVLDETLTRGRRLSTRCSSLFAPDEPLIWPEGREALSGALPAYRRVGWGASGLLAARPVQCLRGRSDPRAADRRRSELLPAGAAARHRRSPPA